MRRILAVISIAFAVGAFVLLCLVLPLQINILIPIFMFVIAFLLLMIVKRMNSDETGADNAKPNELAFYDDTDETDETQSENTGRKNGAQKKNKTKTKKANKR